MDFLKGTKEDNFIENTNNYTLYDTYKTEHRARVYAETLKRAGKLTKVKEKNEDEWQLWWRD
jgi:hypothetical protein